MTEKVTDLATFSLANIIGSPDYEKVSGVPVFDAHQEFDAKGNLVRDFTPEALQKIADLNNSRLATGDVGFVGFGHTILPQKDASGLLVKAKEEDQPPWRGVLTELKVGPFGPSKKVGLLATFYMKKIIRLADGRIISGREALAEFPRRSIELWPDGLIDWVALLRITPQRDLGTTVGAEASQHSREAHAAILLHSPWETLKSRLYLDQSRRRAACAIVDGLGKLRYSMEDSMPLPDPTAAPDVNANPAAPQAGHDLSPDEQNTADRYAMYYKSGACKHYAAGEGPGAPGPGVGGPTGSYVPGAIKGLDNKLDPEEEKKKMQFARGSAGAGVGTPAQYQRMEAELAAMRDALARKDRAINYERDLRVLLDAGFEFNIDEELADVIDLEQAQFDKHKGRIVAHYTKSPVGGGFIPTRTPVSASKGMTREQMEKAKRLATKKGIDFDSAMSTVNGAAN